jgi:potassium/hydrogen antiporter
VTVSLIFILFQGGMDIGWRRFRQSLGPIAANGLAGTVLTVGATSILVHVAFGWSWYVATAVATAVAPTDPAVVFSVLGQLEIEGRAGTILEGESGANDPVGIALMVALIAGAGAGAGELAGVAEAMARQLGVGLVIGGVGGHLLLWFTRRVPLPSDSLYPLRSASAALLLYGAATVGRGSGFLAVFVAGIVVGDASIPFRREIRRFHGALASLGEIVAFTMLGFTVHLGEIEPRDVWLPGIIIGAALALVIRPAVVGALLAPVRLERGERWFVLLAGLKGAVPILLATFMYAAHLPDYRRLYGVVFVVVLFSVVVQGTSVLPLARRLHLRMHQVALEPWALGVRLQDKPNGVYNLVVAEGSRADGSLLREVPGLPPATWISLVVRDGRLLPAGTDARLQAGDDVLVQSGAAAGDQLGAVFGPPEDRRQPA